VSLGVRYQARRPKPPFHQQADGGDKVLLAAGDLGQNESPRRRFRKAPRGDPLFDVGPLLDRDSQAAFKNRKDPVPPG
ncbi:MAG: hypothetical protein GY847_16835, partial [Proteobacteria bacterium]|nr:hypothetical protein [Pseudomonadota bacterium]